ncbi:FecR domain-containing protein [Chitinibacter fontanus]|uniref:FecR domain-containing protein n=1 Tax=Chitinibacter fontanus TaxID=1737446 RepID=A0A7D5Z0Y4_9NEIS|nr:FecR domain-containing protein [Chitinibacter fontanus]QLI80541.1 FecR domain-containing protein [Chitinibacter fontanus]
MFFLSHTRSIRTLLLATLMASSPMTMASDAMHAYTVQANDNLYQIAAKLLNRPSDWQTVAKLNAIANPNLLQPGSTVQIPVRLMRGAPQTAQILYLRGEVKIIAGPNKGKNPVVGQTLREGDTIAASAGAWLGLGLQDGSQMYVSPNSQFKLQRLRSIPQAQTQQTELTLKRGRADFAVQPQPAGARFEVKTPLAVTGVRGTRFGVALNEQSKQTLTDLVEGKVVFTAGQETALEAGNGIVMARGQAAQIQALPAAPEWQHPIQRIDKLPYTLPLQYNATNPRLLAQLETTSNPSQIVWLSNDAQPTLNGPIADGHYLLRVRTISAEGLAGKELLTPIQIKTSPAAPLIQAPLQAALVPSGKVPLICAGEDDAKGYLFQTSTQIDFGSNTQEEMIEGARCRWDSQLDTPQQYFWRVATLEHDAQGDWQRGPFSAATAFTVVKAPSSPEAKVSYGEHLRVQWAGEALTTYQLQIARDREFSAPVLDLQLTEPEATLAIPLGCFDYFIRIKSTNQYGMSSEFSKPRRLNTPAVLCSSNGSGLVDGHGKPLRIAD